MNRQSREIFTAVKVLDAYYPNFVKPIECVRDPTFPLGMFVPGSQEIPGDGPVGTRRSCILP